MLRSIFTDWQSDTADKWGKVPMRLNHRLAELDLFSDDDIFRLVETYPHQHYNLFYTNHQIDRKDWREGELGNLKGSQIVDMIEQNGIWLNLRNLRQIDSRFDKLASDIFKELHGRVPGLETFDQTLGMLISSPNAKVYYHSDLPGQSLWQIRGTKTVYVYPTKEPFISRRDLETITFDGQEHLKFNPEYDQFAEKITLKPGQMATWPLNGPHRVENANCLNVSITMEYWTDAIRARYKVSMANAIMRNKFGINPKSVATHGINYNAKNVLQSLYRRTGLIKSHQRSKHNIDFQLDTASQTGITDIPGYQK